MEGNDYGLIFEPAKMTTREQSMVELKGKYICLAAIIVLVPCIVCLVALFLAYADYQQLETQVEDLQGEAQSLRESLHNLQSQITRMKSKEDWKDPPREETMLEVFSEILEEAGFIMESLEEEDSEQKGSKNENIFYKDRSVDEGNSDEGLIVGGSFSDKRSLHERGRKRKLRDHQKHHRHESEGTI